jgi:hypothetical protein
MRKTVLCLAQVLLGAFVFAQEIKDPNAEKRNVSAFHGIEVATGIKLLLTKGTTEEVVVSADKTEFRDKIVTEVENGILKIHYETKLGSINRRSEPKNLRAYVSYKQLDKLDMNTGAEVDLKDILTTPSLDLRATTGALFNGEINTNSLKVDMSTGARINISGKAEKMEADGSTGSKMEGEDLKTSNCYINLSTGAKVTITAEKDLKVRAGTGGVVKYKGNASISEIKTSTGGEVSKI